MRLLSVLFLVAAVAAPAQDVHVRVDPNDAAAGGMVYQTIQQAIDHLPEPRSTTGARYIIGIAPGVYHERLVVERGRPGVTLLGMGKDPADVVITASENAKSAGGTSLSATVEVDGEGFEADNLTFENAAPPPGPVGGQAVAMLVRSDRAVFKRCRFLSDQDTLYAEAGRQYYVDSFITGGVDFIFGNATAVFDHDVIQIIRPGYLTAQSRTSPEQTTGYVITHSKVTSTIASMRDAAVRKGFFMGRPWRPYARVVVMHTELPADLDPAGWSLWHAGDPVPPLAYDAEFENSGPGFRPKERAAWSRQLTAAEAATYAPERFLAGDDHWDPIAAAAALPGPDAEIKPGTKD
jgi:pectinesterase